MDGFVLGNLGYSSIHCDSTPASVEHFGLICPYGTIGEIYDYGLHENADGDRFEMCMSDEYMRDCKPDSASFTLQLY